MKKRSSRSLVRALRRRQNLSILQLARATGKSAGTIEAWEEGRRTPAPLKEIRAQVQNYLSSGAAIALDNNLLFKAFELSVARGLLRMEIVQLAHEYDYSVDAWRSFEMNRRKIPDAVLRRLEEKIRKELKQLAVI